MLGSVTAGLVVAPVVVAVVVVFVVAEVIVRRGGGVGVICDEVLVDPPASAPAGSAREIPTEAMAAANLDFTGFGM